MPHGFAGLFDRDEKLVLHLNKAGSRTALYRASGSVAWVAACRSAWLVARDPEEAQRCVLAQLKNNLAVPQSSLAIRPTTLGTQPHHRLGPAVGSKNTGPSWAILLPEPKMAVTIS